MTGVTNGRGGSDFVEGRQCRHLVGDLPVHPDEAVTRLPTEDGTDDGTASWLVTGYAQTREFLRDKRFSRAVLAETCHPRGPATRMSVTEFDPPEHTQIRNLIGSAYSARRSEQLRPSVDAIAERLLDELLGAGPTADLLRDFCAPLTFAAQCELLGIPDGRRKSVFERATERLGEPGSDRAEIYRGELGLHAEIGDLLADHDDPPTGLMAELVETHHDGLLTWQELNGLAASLFFDGHALAAAQLANAVLCLLSRPELADRARHSRELLDDVVEESLRYTPAVTLSMPRVATEDVELGGVRIRADDQVIAAIPLANRDDDTFDEPHEFDAGRPTRHLAFGYGTHHCLGAHLARVELQAALSVLLRRVPELHLAVPEQELSWTVSSTMRTLSALPVRWRREAWVEIDRAA